VVWLQSEVDAGLKELSPQTSFLASGIDSVGMTAIAVEIQEATGIPLTPDVLYQYCSIDALAGYLQTRLAVAPAGSSPPPAPPATDWDADLVLAPDIQPPPRREIPVGHPQTVLLTGATGFLGAFLLHELLRQTGASVVCPVRCQDAAAGLARLRANLDTYSLWDGRWQARLVVLPADLSKPRLGVDAGRYRRLAAQIEAIYHSGARLHFHESYAALKPDNVEGTVELLRLAACGRTKPLHYVSTLAVLPPPASPGGVCEQAPPGHPARLENGYAQSKAVAEHLVRAAGARGLPIAIYRPGVIIGSSTTGACSTQDLFARLLKGCTKLGLALPPHVPVYRHLEFQPSPVDYISQALVALAGRPDSLGQTFHLANPRILTHQELVDRIRAAGYPLREVSYQEWHSRLAAAAARGDPDLQALLPFYPGVEPRNAIPTLHADCQATLTRLAGNSIACPPVDAPLLRNSLKYLARIDFCPPLP
jgi:thioester reductase-like protein